SDSGFTRVPGSPEQDNVRAIATVGGVTYVAAYGYGVERLQGSQRTLIWPEANSDSRLREVTSLGKDANDRLLIGTASAGIFFVNPGGGKQSSTEGVLDRLKGDAIWWLMGDGPDLWIGSAKGLFLFQSGQLKDIAPGVSALSLSISAGNAHSK